MSRRGAGRCAPPARRRTTLAVGLTVAGLTGCSDLAGIEEKRYVEGSGGAAGAGGGAGSAGAGGLDGRNPGRPPPRQFGGPRPFSVGALLVARRLYFGTTTESERDPLAWRRLGFDLDGEHTSRGMLEAVTSRTCISPANLDALADGEDGRDNVIGATFFQQLADADSSAEDATNFGLERGATTLILRLRDVNDWETDDQVPAELLIAASEENGGPHPPRWDFEDTRRISSFSYWPGTTQPVATFPDGYISEGMWVSGEQDQARVDLWLPLHPRQFTTVLAHIVAEGGWLTASLGGGNGGPGGLGFAMTPGAFVEMFRNNVITALGCQNSGAADAMLGNLSRNTDLLLPSPWAPDPDARCNALSLAFGFEWVKIRQTADGMVAEEATTPSCPTP